MPNIYLPIIANDNEPSLKDLFAKRGIRFGFAADYYIASAYPPSAPIVKKHAAIIVPEDQMKMAPTQPKQGIFDFKKNDDLVAWGKANNVAIHGTCLMWSQRNPDWLKPSITSPEDAERILRTHVRTISSRYYLTGMDVVNEFYTDPGIWGYWLAGRAPSIALTEAVNSPKWYNGLFRAPDEINQVLDMAASGMIDGVGIQWHVNAGQDLDALIASVKSFAQTAKSYGVQVRLSEVSVLENGNASQSAQTWKQAVRLALDIGAIDFIVWGTVDPSWRGDALLFDENGKAKAGYYAVVEEIQR